MTFSIAVQVMQHLT